MEKVDIERKIYMREKMIDDFTFRVLAIFSFVLPIFVIPGIFYYIPLAKAALLKITASVFLLVWAYYTVSTRRIRWRSTLLDLPLLLFAGVMALSSVFALNPTASLLGSWSERFEELPSWIAYLVIFVAAVNYQGKLKRVATISKSLVAGSVVVSLYGIFQRFGYDLTRFGWAQQMRSSATLGNPIVLGAYLNLVIPIALALTLAAKYKEEKIFWGLSATLAGLTLIFTGSRGGWLGGIVGLLAFLAILFWRRLLLSYRKELVSMAFVLLLTILVGFYAGSRVGGVAAPVTRIEATRAEQGSLATRFSIWRSSLRMIGDRPLLGWGFENFRDLFGVYREERHVLLTQGRVLADRPHGQLLYIAFATGFAGLLAFLWLIFAFTGAIFRRTSAGDDQSQEQSLLFTGLVAAAVAYLAQEQFSFSVPAVAPIFWLTIGLSLNPSLQEQALNRIYHSIPAKMSYLLALTSTALAFVLVATSALALGADFNYYKGLTAVKMEGDQEAVRYYEKAIRLNPLKGEYRLSLARAYRRLAYASENPIWLKRALPILKRGIRLEPQSPDLYFALAEIYYAGSNLASVSDYTLAIQWAKEGLERLPHSEDGRTLLAESLIGEGNYDQALEELRTVLNHSPLETKALFAAGRAMLGKGDKATAALFFKRTLQINPSFEEARRALRQIEQQNGSRI